MTADGTDDPEAGRGEFPLRTFLGMELHGDDGPGAGTAEIDLDERHHNPNGVAHGAVLFALVDTAMGKATMSVVDDGRWCASVEVSLRFIRAVAAGHITARATVVRRGRHLAHLDAEVHGDDGQLVATAAGTFAIIGG